MALLLVVRAHCRSSPFQAAEGLSFASWLHQKRPSQLGICSAAQIQALSSPQASATVYSLDAFVSCGLWGLGYQRQVDQALLSRSCSASEQF